MALNIVTCSLKHRAVLAEIGATTFYQSYKNQNTEADMQTYIQNTYTIPKMESCLNNENIVYFLAYHQTGDVGYVKLLLNQNHEKLVGKTAEIEKIYVRQAFHGQGIAQQLMAHVKQYCKQNEYQNIYLGVWQENYKALKFYNKEGFVKFDIRTFKLGDRICDDFMLNFIVK
jgi:ribosomal protein S18 acetylase RimI-like enzyme